MPIRRFRVAEESMLPALRPGEEIVVTDSRRPLPGEIVVLPHPDRDGFWLVKRMVEPSTSVPHDMAWVLSDNQEVTKADSRSFGPIPIETLQPRVEKFDETSFAEAVQLLAKEDPALSSLLTSYGPPSFRVRSAGFETLVLLIVEQQLSLASARAIYGRLEELCGQIETRAILEAGEIGLMGIGVLRTESAISTRTRQRSLVWELRCPIAGKGDRCRSAKPAHVLEGSGTVDCRCLLAIGTPTHRHLPTRRQGSPVGDAESPRPDPDPFRR